MNNDWGWSDEWDYEKTPDGLPIIGMRELNGKLYVFTAEHVYVLKQIPKWKAHLRRLWRKLWRQG